MVKKNDITKCKAGEFTTNKVVLHGALICHGGFGQPECKFLNECKRDVKK